MIKAFSPFNPALPAKILKRIPSSEIVSGYKTIYNLDVSRFFFALPEIYLCECPLTELQFYFPFHLDGDGAFYAELSKNGWYYDQERWEHAEVVSRIHEKERVLEIGSGDGAFLKQLIKKKQTNALGLELNPNAVERAKTQNIPVVQEDLSKHILGNDPYDVLCSFQVMEHVSDIHKMLSDSVKAIRVGGRMIIAVPNNDAWFLKNNPHPSRFLNTPPHHVNLFGETSLSNLSKVLPIKLVELVKEPIQDSHLDVYLYKIFSKLVFGNKILSTLIWKSRIPLFLKPLLSVCRGRITGHTIIAVFEKQ